MSKPFSVRLPEDLESRLDAFIAERGSAVNKGLVLREALKDYLDDESQKQERDEMEARIAATMSRVLKEIRVARNETHVLMAMFDSFIRSYMFHTAPVPEDAFKAQAVSAEQRYRKVMDQVPTLLQGGALSGLADVFSRDEGATGSG
jgi:metal-responsive CopG/Arc/MetJ family transcriptional regulator